MSTRHDRHPSQYRSTHIVFVYLALACLLLLGAPVIRADRYVVPTNDLALYPFGAWTNAATNIQDAVNAATNGETVWLTNGTYFCQGVSTCIWAYNLWPMPDKTYTNTAMVVITNSITLKSWSGTYSNTVISGNYPAWTTRVVMAVNTGAVLDGLTISNGWIYTNTANLGVAGVFFSGKLMTNCLVAYNYTSNNSVWLYPAGICMQTGIISHCVIMSNAILGSKISFGALYVSSEGGSGPWIVSNCVIKGNKTSTSGTIFINNDVMLINSDISENIGHGISPNGSNWRISSCTIRNNTEFGIYMWQPNTNGFVRNCLITSNKMSGIGFGYAAENKVGIENCTIVNNGRPGFHTWSAASRATNITVANCIIYYNTPYGGETNWGAGSGTNAVFSNCCTIPMPTNLPGLPEGTGNITNAPMFVDTNAENYRLSNTSPCINAGVNRDWMTNTVDLDGRVRIRYGTVDMGAYETIYEGTIYRFP